MVRGAKKGGDPGPGGRSWAEIVGKAGQPCYVFPLILWLVADAATFTRRGLLIAVALSAATMGIMILGMLLFSRFFRKRFPNLFEPTRKERSDPLTGLLALLSVGAPWVALRFLDLPERISAFYAAVLGMTIVGYLLNFLLKVSGHALAWTSLASTALALGVRWSWMFLPMALLVSSARVVSRHHNVPEVVVGSLVGLTIPPLLFWSYGIL